MRPRPSAPSSLACLLAALALASTPGCGSDPEPPPRARIRPPVVEGPGPEGAAPRAEGRFDAAWAARAPDVGFAYLAFSGRALADKLAALAGEDEAREGAPRGALAGWLRVLRARAGAEGAFPAGAAVVLGAAPQAAGPRVDFWLCAPTSPGLERALGGGLTHPGLPALTRGAGSGPVVVSTRPEWAAASPGGEGAWFQASRRGVEAAQAVGTFSASRFLAQMGPHMRGRGTNEEQVWKQVAAASPTWTLAAQAFEGSLRFELDAELVPGAPLGATLARAFAGGQALAAPSVVPGVSPVYLGASLDWEAARSLREALAPSAAEGPGPASPFAPGAGGAEAEPAADDPLVLARGLAGWLGENILSGVFTWGGPEASGFATWDTRVPRLGLLVANRSPRAAAKAAQDFHRSEVGQRLTFVDDTLRGVPFRYTRIPGEDPRLIEPAYCFVDGFLAVASSRDLLGGLLDDGAPKLEADTSVGGVLARLGGAARVLGFLRPGLLTRVTALVRQAAGPEGDGAALGQAEARFAALDDRVVSLAVGAAAPEGKRLQVVTMVSLRPDDEDG